MMLGWIVKRLAGLLPGRIISWPLVISAGAGVLAIAGYIGWLHWSIAEEKAERLAAEKQVVVLTGDVRTATEANASLKINQQLLASEMAERSAGIVSIVTRTAAFTEGLADNRARILHANLPTLDGCSAVPGWLDAWLDGHGSLRFEPAGAERGDQGGDGGDPPGPGARSTLSAGP